MSKFATKFIDVAGRVLRKIPNVPGKSLYSKTLLKPIIHRWDMEFVLPLHSGETKLVCRLTDWIPWNVYLHGSYIVEDVYEQYLLRIAEQSQTIFDIGANIGYYTVQFAQKTDGKVYAFEPMDYQHHTLLRNLELNSVTNVQPVKKIVSNTNGRQRIYFSGMENTAASSVVNETDQYEDISSISLDTFCRDNQIENIDLIKIDVEGFELNVLKGLENMLKPQKVAHLFIEVVEKHLNKAGTSAKELCDLLEFYNYKGYSVKSGKPEPYGLGSDESLVYFKPADQNDPLEENSEK
ncbi:hypothetical protein BH23BAC3_BH23BAC3_32780 [soil metagenome]